MSLNLFAYLESAPSLDDIRATLSSIGLNYRHTLPADDRWNYPMHVFGRADLRVVYHAGDPRRGEAMIDTCCSQETPQALVALQLVLTTVVRHYGGSICDPRQLRRGAVL